MTETQEPQGISPAALKSALSEPRLEAYRLRPDEPLEAVLGRYRWNVALGMSFYPALGLLEVALRNNLHRVISGYYGNEAWYDLTPAVLAPREQDSIRQAKVELRAQGRPEAPHRVVATLSFGFWTSLLSTDYEQKLWPRLLSSAFPHIPRRERTRSNIARRLHQIRIVLRNRISHHEPIYRLENLAQLYDDLREAIRWLSPTLLRLLPIGEDFREVYARGCTAYEIRPT